MSFHTGQSFTFGETPSATKWNYLWENDYALADGTGIEDDAIDSRHYVDASVDPQHLNFSGCAVYRATSTNVSNTTFTAVPFVSESYDTDSYHDNSSNTSRLTIPATGKYRITYALNFNGNSTGQRYVWLAKNGNSGTGAGKDRYAFDLQNGLAVGNGHCGSVDLSLTAGDYIELMVYQDSGGTRAVLGDDTQTGFTRLSIHRLS